MSFAFLGLGGTDEVGASSYLYLLKEGNLLIDAGLRPGRLGEAALPKLELLKEHPPSAMILTHAHLDHIAALPIVIRRFPKLHIYCTEATSRIAPLVLMDTIKVSTAQGHSMFSEIEMVRTLERMRPIPYFQRISDYGYTFSLYPSGHIIGAASVLIETGGNRSIFHTGDVSNVQNHVVDAAWLPEKPYPVDAVVSESTYGDTLLPSRKDQVRAFIEGIRGTLENGGNILIPSFALGRAQEIVQIVSTSMDSKLLPRKPIYLDGLTRQMTELYENMLPMLPSALQKKRNSGNKPVFINEHITPVKDRKMRDQVINSSGGSIVISSSGMLHAGASPIYARAWLPDANNALFVVGYQDAESPGRRLLELKQGGEVMLPNENQQLEAVAAYSRIERFYLSAHADRGGLLGMIARYEPQKVLLTHGEVSARNNMIGYLSSKIEGVLPVAGEIVNLEDTGRRKRTFINSSPKALEARKERFAKSPVEVNYDADHHVLVIQLPEEIDGSMFSSGTFSMEVLQGLTNRIKLRQQEEHSLNPPSN